ncbi:DnaJ-like protein [Scheffersomyces amazonensis]|uniref:DnaJ-like protein n=1 Tax=Scheffersomyces amazonensis TaxID=1078765 RepID=UPI00315CA2B1
MMISFRTVSRTRLGVFSHIHIFKTYATAASPPPSPDFSNNDNNVDHHKRLDLHPWPNKKNPSPYEIFNIETNQAERPSDELKRELKKTYVKYVKIYHPDTSQVLLDDKGNELTTEQKRNRYDQIQNAYDILKNPTRNAAYYRYSTTNWDQQGFYDRSKDNSHPFNKNNFEAYRRGHAHRTKYNFENDEAFWQAGSWEDYYQMKYGRRPPTREEIEKNKYKILMGVIAVGVLGFGIQVMLAIDKSNEYYAQMRLSNLKSMKDLDDSRNNHGFGPTQLQRLTRFLASRRTSRLVKHEEDDEFIAQQIRDLKEQDDELLVQYARKQVSKWD